jgi:hypothetical protein
VRVCRIRFVESFTLKTENAIGTGAIIFPRNGGAQFHKLRSGEALLQARAQLRRHARGSGGDSVSEFENELFIVTEEVAGVPIIEIAKLFVGDSGPPTRGGVNINSKRAFDELGRAHLAQNFQPAGHQIGLIQRHIEAGIRNKHSGMSCRSLKGSNVSAQSFSGKPLDHGNLESLEHYASFSTLFTSRMQHGSA